MKTDSSNIENRYEKFLRWLNKKIYIQEKFDKNNQQYVNYPRSAIYTCYFGENIGHEKSRLEARPCVVVSTDLINSKNTNVIVVPLSKQIKYKGSSKTELRYDWHYVLRKKNYPSLDYDSAVQCEDIRSISKSRLGKFITTVNPEDMKKIRKRIKKALQV